MSFILRIHLRRISKELLNKLSLLTLLLIYNNSHLRPITFNVNLRHLTFNIKNCLLKWWFKLFL